MVLKSLGFAPLRVQDSGQGDPPFDGTSTESDRLLRSDSGSSYLLPRPEPPLYLGGNPPLGIQRRYQELGGRGLDSPFFPCPNSRFIHRPSEGPDLSQVLSSLVSHVASEERGASPFRSATWEYGVSRDGET